MIQYILSLLDDFTKDFILNLFPKFLVEKPSILFLENSILTKLRFLVEKNKEDIKKELYVLVPNEKKEYIEDIKNPLEILAMIVLYG